MIVNQVINVMDVIAFIYVRTFIEFGDRTMQLIIHFKFQFTASRDPTISTGCEHCPPGMFCDPTTGACIRGNA